MIKMIQNFTTSRGGSKKARRILTEGRPEPGGIAERRAYETAFCSMLVKSRMSDPRV
jgi:hypothetical protein